MSTEITTPEEETRAYGDVPFIDPVTGRFPDEFAPPSVATNTAKAETAATNADASKTTASTAATTATTKAAEASASKNASKTSEDNAKASELAAKASENASHASEVSAAEDAITASTAASSASEDAATASASALATEADAAATAADRVATNADALTATTKAQEADASADAAKVSETNSAASAAASELSATESDGFRDLSSDAATTASTSANDAEAARAAAAALLAAMQALRDAPNGYATLDSSGLLSPDKLPVGAMTFQGAWNASTNSPALANGTGKRGYVYIVQTSGNRDLGSGVIDFLVGDQLVHDGTRWHKIDNTDQVTSVAGRQGAITLTKSDVGLSNVDNTSDANKPVSTATQTVLNTTVNGGSVVGDNLVLTQVGGGQVTAGNVRGPKGDKGDQGDIAAAYSGTVTGTVAINQSTIPYTATSTLTGNTTFIFSGTAPSGKSGTITYTVKQAASGGPYTVTWPASVVWSGPAGTPAPAMPTQAGAELMVHLFWTGTRWVGMFGGVFL